MNKDVKNNAQFLSETKYSRIGVVLLVVAPPRLAQHQHRAQFCKYITEIAFECIHPLFFCSFAVQFVTHILVELLLYIFWQTGDTHLLNVGGVKTVNIGQTSRAGRFIFLSFLIKKKKTFRIICFTVHKIDWTLNGFGRVDDDGSANGTFFNG